MTRAQFAEHLRLQAEHWVGTPFVWHGQTRRGADCLGVIVGVLRSVGVAVPTGDGSPYESHWFLHDRGQNRYLQALLTHGREVPAEEAAPGDVVAFWNRQPTPKVVHSGLYLGDGRFLHARRAAGARIDALSDPQFAESRITVIRLRAVEETVDG